MTDSAYIPTSLGRAPSSYTEDQRAENEHRLESAVWHAKGKVIIDINDYRLPQGLRDLCEAVGIARFGKRALGNTRGI